MRAAILCDPWVNPAYFASWFPFPDNSGLDWDTLGDCDYLYVSHLHKDHYDAKHLSAHVNKDAVVLLPDYPVPDLRNQLQNFGVPPVLLRPAISVKHRLSGPKRRPGHHDDCPAAPADGPIGDSALVVSERRDNDFQHERFRPVDLDMLTAGIRAHRRTPAAVLRAIWYRWSTTLPARAKESFGTQKRQRQMDRAAITSPRWAPVGWCRRPGAMFSGPRVAPPQRRLQ